jgi:hypothetical protein
LVEQSEIFLQTRYANEGYLSLKLEVLVECDVALDKELLLGHSVAEVPRAGANFMNQFQP